MQGSLYTAEIHNYVHSLPFPKGFILDTTEAFDDNPYPRILFVIYRDNLVTFGEDDLRQISETMNKMMMKLRGDGVPCFLLPLANREELNARA